MSTPSLRERALGYLTRREYSRQELYRKLRAYAGDEDLDVLLDEFKQRGWLSDERYVDQMVHARKGKYGSQKLAYELRAQGVAEDLVGKALEELQMNEQETARTLWQKKFGSLPVTRDEWSRQARYLQGRGFDTDTIRQVLRGSADDTD